MTWTKEAIVKLPEKEDLSDGRRITSGPIVNIRETFQRGTSQETGEELGEEQAGFRKRHTDLTENSVRSSVKGAFGHV